MTDIGRYWLQAKRNLADENWDAAVVTAGSAMQLALRAQGAKGGALSQEVEDLSKKGILPPIMVEWADEVRWLRNPTVHPAPGQNAPNPKDARDVGQLLNILETVALYQAIRAEPTRHWVPRVKIFAGKAAANYAQAKLIIKLRGLEKRCLELLAMGAVIDPFA